MFTLVILPIPIVYSLGSLCRKNIILYENFKHVAIVLGLTFVAPYYLIVNHYEPAIILIAIIAASKFAKLYIDLETEDTKQHWVYKNQGDVFLLNVKESVYVLKLIKVASVLSIFLYWGMEHSFKIIFKFIEIIIILLILMALLVLWAIHKD